jgi:replicative DNA helicase
MRNAVSNSTPRARVYSLAELVDEIANEHESADLALASGKNLGPAIPFARLGDEMGGYWPVGMIGMHAKPGAGKSAFGIQTAMQAECPAVILTCEMSPHTVLRRMIAGRFLGDLRIGKSSATAIRAAAEALAKAHPHVAIIDAVTAPCPPDLLEATAKKLRGYGDNLFIVVDSLHAWSSAIDPALEEYQAVSAGVDSLRRIASTYHASVLAVLERNRASMQTGGISAGAATRKIEYSAEAILELAFVGDGNGVSAVNLTIAKTRNGRNGVIIGFNFDGAKQRFTEVGDPWPGEDRAKKINKIAGKRNLLSDEMEDD